MVEQQDQRFESIKSMARIIANSKLRNADPQAFSRLMDGIKDIDPDFDPYPGPEFEALDINGSVFIVNFSCGRVITSSISPNDEPETTFNLCERHWAPDARPIEKRLQEHFTLNIGSLLIGSKQK